MRAYDIAYVGNPAPPTFQIPFEDMTLQELTKTHLRSCAKSNGKISVCRDCTKKCQYGVRALDLYDFKVTPGEAFVDPNLTILARKKAEEEKAAQEKAKPAKMSRREYDESRNKASEDWYRAALKSGDPVKYTMETLGINKHKAKAKIYNYCYAHKDIAERIEDEIRKEKQEKLIELAETNIGPKENKPEKALKINEEKTPVVTDAAEVREQETGASNDDLLSAMEHKIKLLRVQQAGYQAQIEEINKRIKEIDDKIEALDLCMNVFRS